MLKVCQNCQKVIENWSSDEPCDHKNDTINLICGYVLEQNVCHVWWKFQSFGLAWQICGKIAKSDNIATFWHFCPMEILKYFFW